MSHGAQNLCVQTQTGVKRDLQKRPMNTQRDPDKNLPKRPINMKNGLHIRKETYEYAKRPMNTQKTYKRDP